MLWHEGGPALRPGLCCPWHRLAVLRLSSSRNGYTTCSRVCFVPANRVTPGQLLERVVVCVVWVTRPVRLGTPPFLLPCEHGGQSSRGPGSAAVGPLWVLPGTRQRALRESPALCVPRKCGFPSAHGSSPWAHPTQPSLPVSGLRLSWRVSPAGHSRGSRAEWSRS